MLWTESQTTEAKELDWIMKTKRHMLHQPRVPYASKMAVNGIRNHALTNQKRTRAGPDLGRPFWGPHLR